MSKPKWTIQVTAIIAICLTLLNGRMVAQTAPRYRLAFIWVALQQTDEAYPYVIDSDGSNGTPLKKAYPATEGPIRWSPDGKHLAYACNVGEGVDICSIDANGANPRRLTRNPGLDYQFHWSPDGTKIGFITDRDGHFGQIYLMNADGSNQIPLNQEGGDCPEWSPDWSKIAVERSPGDKGQIYVLNGDGSNAVNIGPSQTNALCPPIWSPDGKRLYYGVREGDNFDIYAMNADGSNPVNLTNTLEPEYLQALAPDGKRLAFSKGHIVHQVIYLMDTDGSNIVRVGGEDVNKVTWSPDGRYLAAWSGISVEVIDLACPETASDCIRSIEMIKNLRDAEAVSPADWSPVPIEDGP